MNNFFYLPAYRIAVCGHPGTGTTSLSDLIVSHFNNACGKNLWVKKSGGDIFRAVARKKYPDLSEEEAASRLAGCADDEVDHEVDRATESISLTQNHIVIDARLAAKFMPEDTFRVLLICDAQVAARRVASRAKEKNPDVDLEAVALAAINRTVNDELRYAAIYNCTVATQVERWDLVFDTGDPKNTPQHMLEVLSSIWPDYVSKFDARA